MAKQTDFSNDGDLKAIDGSIQSDFTNRVIDDYIAYSIENVGEEPVITADAGNVSVTIAAGAYAGTYTQRASDSATLTAAMIEAAPTCIKLPVVSGTETVGETLTAVAGLWVYDGADPGAQTWEWQNDTDGATGDTDLSYVLVAGDSGDTMSIDETFGGVTVSSVSTGTIGGGGATFPVTTALGEGSTTAISSLDYSASFTPTAGTNRCLWVLVDVGTASVPGVPTVTLNGTGFTQQATLRLTEASRAAFWSGYLLDADISSGTLSITFPNSTGDVDSWAFTVVELDGVNQTTPVGSTATRGSFGSFEAARSLTLSSFSTGSRALTHGCWRFVSTVTPSSDGGGTFTNLQDTINGDVVIEEWGGTPPTSVSHTFTRSASESGPSMGMYEINEA